MPPERPGRPPSGAPNSQRNVGLDTAQATHALVEGVREGAAVLAPNRTVLTCNRRLAEMLKLDCAAIVGRSMLAFIPPGDQPRFEKFLSSCADEFSQLHLRLSGGNAFPLPVEFSAKQIDASNGPVYSLLATDLSRRRRAEEQLAFQAHLLAHVSDAILATDEHYRITHWNPAAERLYGWTADQVLGRTMSEVVHPELSPDETRALNRELAQHGQFDNESWHHRKGGARIWVEAKRSALRGPEGRLLGYVSINRDLTEHKRAEELGRLHAEQIQKHAQQMQKFAEQMQSYADERRLHAARLEQRVHERTAELEHANQALQKENAERQAEIHARQETEAKLKDVFQSLEDTMLAARESEELVRVAIEAAGMVAWTYDPEKDKVITIARTGNWAEMMPEASAPLLGRGLEYVHPDDRARVTEALPRVVAGEAFSIELRLLLPDGALRWIETQGRLMTGVSGRLPLLVGVTQDITERRQIEESLRRLNRELEAERARWQGVVEGIADEVWVANLDGRMSLINLPQVTHMGLDEFEDKTVAQVDEEVDILDPDGRFRPLDEAPLLRALQGEIVRGEEIMVHHRTGRKRFRQYSAAPTRDASGAITGSVAIVRDITEHKLLEDQLRASEQRLRRMVNVGRFGVLTFDAATGTILDANDAFLEMTGYNRAQVEAHALSWQTMTPPEFVDVSRQQMAQLRTTGHLGPYEKQYIRRDGSRSWMLFAGADVGDGTTVEYCVDINDRKQLQQALAETGRRVQEILESIQDGFFALDREWRFTYVNQRAAQNVGMGVDSLIGQNLWEQFPALRGTPLEKQYRRAMTERVPLRTETSGAMSGTMYEVRIYPSAEGISVYWIDITERLRAEVLLRKRETALAQAGRMAQLGAWDVEIHNADNLNANPLTWSDEVYRIFGYTPGEVPATNELFFERVHPDDRARLAEAVAHARATRQPYSIEHRILRPNGEERIVHEHAEFFFDAEGKPVRLVGAVQDITERKRSEDSVRRLNRDLERRATELEIANRELESFTYSVSHDLRTPLATIENFAKLLQGDYGSELGQGAQRYVAMIHASAQQLEQLIQSLLALSRLSRRALKPEPVNMRALVQDALETLHRELERPDLTIEVRDLSNATADPVLLKQVWVNLIANAAKFTRQCGNARIEIACETQDGEERVYYVRDNGVGFDMAQADRLFQVFQRLHGEDEYEGTGVGLALVARIVHRHGGRVWAEGKVNEGATFYFTLSA